MIQDGFSQKAWIAGNIYAGNSNDNIDEILQKDTLVSILKSLQELSDSRMFSFQ
jgi:hypothetical protein